MPPPDGYRRYCAEGAQRTKHPYQYDDTAPNGQISHMAGHCRPSGGETNNRPAWMCGSPVPRSSQTPEELGFRRSEEHTSELQSLMRISYAVFCLKKKKIKHTP